MQEGDARANGCQAQVQVMVGAWMARGRRAGGPFGGGTPNRGLRGDDVVNDRAPHGSAFLPWSVLDLLRVPRVPWVRAPSMPWRQPSSHSGRVMVSSLVAAVAVAAAQCVCYYTTAPRVTGCSGRAPHPDEVTDGSRRSVKPPQPRQRKLHKNL